MKIQLDNMLIIFTTFGMPLNRGANLVILMKKIKTKGRIVKKDVGLKNKIKLLELKERKKKWPE